MTESESEVDQYHREEYAYGEDVVDGCVCPATAAGLNTKHPAVSKIAGRFDEQLMDGFRGMDGSTGIVTSDIACDKWELVIEETQENGLSDELEYAELIYERLWGDTDTSSDVDVDVE